MCGLRIVHAFWFELRELSFFRCDNIFFLRASITIDYMYAKHCGEGKIGGENESELRVYN